MVTDIKEIVKMLKRKLIMKEIKGRYIIKGALK